VVNAFIILPIFLNAISFAAETVEELDTRYAVAFEVFNLFSVAVFTIEYVLRVWSTGDVGDAMFIIAGGEALVDIGPGKHALLKEGDFFGEMALERRRHKHRRCRQDEVPSLCAGQPGPGAPCLPPP
jgi:hypothetical protein